MSDKRSHQQDDFASQDFAVSNEKVKALLSPRNVVIVGASDRPGAWGARVWNNLKKHNYPHAIYPMNPTRAEIWGVRCYPDFGAAGDAGSRDDLCAGGAGSGRHIARGCRRRAIGHHLLSRLW